MHREIASAISDQLKSHPSPFTVETSGCGSIIPSPFTVETSGCGNIIPSPFTV